MIQRMNNFSQNDIISIRDLSKDDLEQIFAKTNEIMEMPAEQRREIARGKLLDIYSLNQAPELDLVFNLLWR